MIKKILNKEGFFVGSLFLVIVLLLALLLAVQSVFLITTSYLVKERCRMSLTALEASIIEDTYEALQDKNFDFYEEKVIDSSENLTDEYQDIFLDFLKLNLGYDEDLGDYIGEYYVIDGDTLVVSVSDVNDDSITVNVSFDLTYRAYMPFLNRQVNYFTKNATVSAQYKFNDYYNEEGIVAGNDDTYSDEGVN